VPAQKRQRDTLRPTVLLPPKPPSRLLKIAAHAAQYDQRG
jgi:hypothetical protein